MADKNELLKAASKLKSAKKRKASESDETTKSVKKVANGVGNNDLAGKIVNAVKRFKGDDQ